MVEVTVDNPLREGLDDFYTPDPTAIIIFGITGDLAARKLGPALYNLANDNLLPQPYSVIGVGRRDWTDDYLRDEMSKDIGKFSRTELNDAVWKGFAQSVFYQQVAFDNPADYRKLRERLDQLDRERGTQHNRLFFLAIPPELYEQVGQLLGDAGLQESKGYTRIIIEKPFGKDLESARTLNRSLRKVFQEDQIYRIDHYLGKETVQNIAVFRFANSIFEPLWNRKYIDHVQITVAETVGVGTRGQYYDESGALRDIIQNHALQVLSLVGMEPPIAWESGTIRDEKVKLLRAIRSIQPADALKYSVRGQYSDGFIEGEPMTGYLKTDEVKPDSMTETYVALKLMIDNWRWSGVPFYLRTGKTLPRRVTEVAIEFQQAPLALFGESAGRPTPNRLILRIQPDEGITLRFDAKLPGQSNKLREVNMDFRYGSAFGVSNAEAYERLLLDAMLGDNKLFTRNDEVEAQWVLMTPFLEGWAQSGEKQLPQYPAGSWGPTEAEEWIKADGRVWRRL